VFDPAQRLNLNPATGGYIMVTVIDDTGKKYTELYDISAVSQSSAATSPAMRFCWRFSMRLEERMGQMQIGAVTYMLAMSRGLLCVTIKNMVIPISGGRAEVKYLYSFCDKGEYTSTIHLM